MEKLIHQLKDALISASGFLAVINLSDNKETYWINKAKEEANFEPTNDSWVHIEVSLYKIEISVYKDHSGSAKGSKHWINGKWFDTCFPGSIPSIYSMK